jgi:hypothetical protein
VLYKYAKVMAVESPDIRRRLSFGLYEMRHLQRGGEM